MVCTLPLLSMQREKELLRAVDDQKRMLEEAQETCVALENKLYHLEEEINNAQKQVNRYPVLLKSAKSYK